MKTQVTASVFWKLFNEAPPAREDIPSLEHLRHRCLLGFTALDAALYTYWESTVIPEWKETLSLVSAALESPSSEEILHGFVENAGPYLKKSQLVATLRFLANTGDGSRFTPNFLDFAAYLLLRKGEDPEMRRLVQGLCELQWSRNAAVHTGRPWSEIQAQRGLKLIQETAEGLALLGKNFAEAFEPSGLRAVPSSKKLHAA